MIEELGRDQINSQAIEIQCSVINTKTAGKTKQAASWKEVHRHVKVDVTVN